jgi:hypothetical protein
MKKPAIHLLESGLFPADPEAVVLPAMQNYRL